MTIPTECLEDISESLGTFIADLLDEAWDANESYYDEDGNYIAGNG